MIVPWHRRNRKTDAAALAQDRVDRRSSKTESVSWFTWSGPISNRFKSWPIKTRFLWAR